MQKRFEIGGQSCTMGRMTVESTRDVLGHSFPCLLIRSLAHSLTYSGAHGKMIRVFELNASIS